jgi:hypothetical protein
VYFLKIKKYFYKVKEIKKKKRKKKCIPLQWRHRLHGGGDMAAQAARSIWWPPHDGGKKVFAAGQ